jgi:hypothetical protein
VAACAALTRCVMFIAVDWTPRPGVPAPRPLQKPLGLVGELPGVVYVDYDEHLVGEEGVYAAQQRDARLLLLDALAFKQLSQLRARLVVTLAVFRRQRPLLDVDWHYVVAGLE